MAKIEDLHFDALLHDSHDEDGVHLAPTEFPRPMFGLAVQAASRGQEQKLSQALQKLTEEDPAFLVEHNVELNETVMDHYLEQGESGLQREELHDAFEQCLREGHLVPVCFVSARSGAGVRELLDRIVQRVPSPKGDANAPARALIFDSVYDTYRGVVTYVRVVDGRITPR